MAVRFASPAAFSAWVICRGAFAASPEPWPAIPNCQSSPITTADRRRLITPVPPNRWVMRLVSTPANDDLNAGGQGDTSRQEFNASRTLASRLVVRFAFSTALDPQYTPNAPTRVARQACRTSVLTSAVLT